MKILVKKMKKLMIQNKFFDNILFIKSIKIFYKFIKI